MTPSETAELLAYCAAFDRRTVGRADVAAWQQLLNQVNFSDARDAVTEHYSTETRWLMPADILRAVRRARAKRIEDATVVYDGNPTETGAEYTRNLRQLLRDAGDGKLGARPVLQAIPERRRLELEVGPQGRMQQALAAIGSMPPRIVPGVVNPLAVGCPHCHAHPGRACRTSIGGRRMADPHPGRTEAAERAAAQVGSEEAAS